MDPIKAVLAAMYMALCGSLGPEMTARANESLRAFADDDNTPDDEGDIYRALADNAEGMWGDLLKNPKSATVTFTGARQ